MRKRVAALVDRARGKVEVVLGDYTAAPDVAATWFVDPPYQPVPCKKTARPRGAGYAGPPLDYRALGEWCRGRAGQVLVAEQAPAAWLPFRPLAYHGNALGERGLEVLWTSEPLAQTELGLA